MTIQGLSGLQRRLNRMERRLKRGPAMTASRELNTVGSLARLNLVKSNSVASGQLAGSFFVRGESLPNGTRKIVLTNIRRYAAYVEYGIGDLGAPTPSGETFGEPSVTPRLVSRIHAWSIVKGIVPVRMDRQAFAHRVAQRIAGELPEPSGHAPKYYMTNAWTARKRSVKRSIRKTVSRSMR
ncbi:Mu gpG-like protein [Haloarcula tailed virus 2]|uniref:Mu gpG-like protein n=1 Tax=Haloarcula tailed virus 2 TaxID=2877989 RepID=A0AAE9BYJ0_9CAUD|nr:Mu gpG-like protein [Haloarcula tailed virus 2]UBF23168.1 Mu gpG-like protein [Haloarcula tailed virus 2]